MKKAKDFKNPKSVKFIKNLIIDKSFPGYLANFIVFNSIDNILCLIYSCVQSIISYNIINNVKIDEIKKAHHCTITNFAHYLDKINQRDLIISFSRDNGTIKLWNFIKLKLELILKIRADSYISSGRFLYDKKEIYIFACNALFCMDRIKIYNLKGKIVKEIKDYNKSLSFIDSYYDKKSSNNYIITGNIGYVKSYDFNKNILYKKYSDKDHLSYHYDVVINDKNLDLKLIEADSKGIIRIWNFHYGILLNKIKTNGNQINCLCLWDNKNLFVGSNDKYIKLVDLEKKTIIN